MKTTLADEVAFVLQSQPDLGAGGFLCPFTNSAANFPAERSAAFFPAFADEVRLVLESLTVYKPGVCWMKRAAEYASFCPNGTGRGVRLGAAIAAFQIAGVRFSRIAGTPDVKISGRGLAK